jgi:hypothetical protein
MEVNMPGPLFWFFPIVGLFTLAQAVRFAFRPAERTLAILRPLTAATAASAVAAVLLGIANALMGLKWAMQRTAESAGAGQATPSAVNVPAILGGSVESLAALAACAALLAVIWVLVAVGLRRQA